MTVDTNAKKPRLPARRRIISVMVLALAVAACGRRNDPVLPDPTEDSDDLG